MTRHGIRQTEQVGFAPAAGRAAGTALCVAVAAMVAAAAPAGAASARHHHPSRHHGHHHQTGHHHHHAALKSVSVDGLVMSHHHSHVTLFATKSRIGRHDAHNTVVHLELHHGGHALSQMSKGYEVHLVASGRGSSKHLVVPRIRRAHVTPTPATGVVGVVDEVAGNRVVVEPFNRVDGHHNGDGGHGRLVVDTSVASVGAEDGAIRRGDVAAILGEVTDHNVLASHVFAFSPGAEELSGHIAAINGGAVTVKFGEGRTTVDLGSGKDQLPLFIDGAPATTDQLRVGDNIAVLGVVTNEEEGFTPLLGFGFTAHDQGPCGDNQERRHRH